MSAWGGIVVIVSAFLLAQGFDTGLSNFGTRIVEAVREWKRP